MAARKKRPAAARRGLTMIEVLVAAGLLAIGVAALVRLHATAIRGVDEGGSMTHALEIALQRIETLSARASGGEALPICPEPAILGCRENTTTLTAETACSEWLLGPEVPAPDGAWTNSPDQRGFRLDVVLVDHPSGDYPGAQLITASVCWLSPTGEVHEIQAQRVVVPGA